MQRRDEPSLPAQACTCSGGPKAAMPATFTCTLAPAPPNPHTTLLVGPGIEAGLRIQSSCAKQQGRAEVVRKEAVERKEAGGRVQFNNSWAGAPRGTTGKVPQHGVAGGLASRVCLRCGWVVGEAGDRLVALVAQLVASVVRQGGGQGNREGPGGRGKVGKTGAGGGGSSKGIVAAERPLLRCKPVRARWRGAASAPPQPLSKRQRCRQ